VDLARDTNDPKTAAEKILAFSEELGGNDNATAIVIPLAGWNRIRGPDKTRELRDYRRLQAGMILRLNLHISFQRKI
jgi:protein phosphatase PTC6